MRSPTHMGPEVLHRDLKPGNITWTGTLQQ